MRIIEEQDSYNTTDKIIEIKKNNSLNSHNNINNNLNNFNISQNNNFQGKNYENNNPLIINNNINNKIDLNRVFNNLNEKNKIDEDNNFISPKTKIHDNSEEGLESEQFVKHLITLKEQSKLESLFEKYKIKLSFDDDKHKKDSPRKKIDCPICYDNNPK